jgi:hypothetical protein
VRLGSVVRRGLIYIYVVVCVSGSIDDVVFNCQVAGWVALLLSGARVVTNMNETILTCQGRVFGVLCAILSFVLGDW